MSKNRILGDSIALAAVKIFTMATSIISTMILSRSLPLTEYGTYSTGNLIYNTATLLSAFGLIDAVNYYYFFPFFSLWKCCWNRNLMLQKSHNRVFSQPSVRGNLCIYCISSFNFKYWAGSSESSSLHRKSKIVCFEKCCIFKC